mgnify:CR=1 FL=1
MGNKPDVLIVNRTVEMILLAITNDSMSPFADCLGEKDPVKFSSLVKGKVNKIKEIPKLSIYRADL